MFELTWQIQIPSVPLPARIRTHFRQMSAAVTDTIGFLAAPTKYGALCLVHNHSSRGDEEKETKTQKNNSLTLFRDEAQKFKKITEGRCMWWTSRRQLLPPQEWHDLAPLHISGTT